mgnify:CR=1 FL=1
MKYCMMFFCRSGFEKECSLEIEDKLKFSDYEVESEFQKNSAYVLVKTNTINLKIEKLLKNSNLIFSRQEIHDIRLISMEESDRVTAILAAIDSIFHSREKLFHNLFCEYFDTEEGKKLHQFCKKIHIPISNRLKKSGYKQVFSNENFQNLHVVFSSAEKAYIGFSKPSLSSKEFMGIKRLRFPHQAPSRSTLKLEEAFHYFLNEEERSLLLNPNKTAVDLGAAPGGWTYQLLNRGMRVTAVDHGLLDKELFNLGNVDHLMEDAFKFIPTSPVDWMVCDIVEKPSRVTKLICFWIKNKLCKQIMCNLKLPMRAKYENLNNYLSSIREQLPFPDQQLKAKHLYHDREEITLYINCRN